MRNEVVALSLKATWSGSERFQFMSLTSAANSSMVFSFDADWGNDEAWAPVIYDYFSASDRDRRTVSQEFRLSSAESGRIFGDTTDWLVGVYAMQLQDDLDTRNVGEYDDSVFSDTLDSTYSGRFDCVECRSVRPARVRHRRIRAARLRH